MQGHIAVFLLSSYNRSIKECFDMANDVQDVSIQTFILSGMLVFADKVMVDEESEKIRRWLEMTKVGRLIEEEKLEYAREQVEKVSRKKEEIIAEKMLKRGDSIEDIKGFFEVLTVEDIEKIVQEMGSQDKAGE